MKSSKNFKVLLIDWLIDRNPKRTLRQLNLENLNVFAQVLKGKDCNWNVASRSIQCLKDVLNDHNGISSVWLQFPKFFNQIAQ